MTGEAMRNLKLETGHQSSFGSHRSPSIIFGAKVLRSHGIAETDCFGRASLAKSVFKNIVIIGKKLSLT